MAVQSSFLVWYQTMDVVPFVEAVTKMKVFWKERDIDMTQCISLPGLAMCFEMGFLKEQNLKLSVFHNEELYDLFRKNMVGGPAIIFKRYICYDTHVGRWSEYDSLGHLRCAVEDREEEESNVVKDQTSAMMGGLSFIQGWLAGNQN